MIQPPAIGPPRPHEVTVASALLQVMSLLLLASGSFGLIDRAGAAQAIDAAQSGTTLRPDVIATLTVVVSVLVVLLGVLLLVAGVATRRGRRWGRVLAFVGAGMMILLNGIGALGGAGLLSVILLGASVGVVALLMQSAAAPYFAGPAPPAGSGG